jgi:hypothetical protein
LIVACAGKKKKKKKKKENGVQGLHREEARILSVPQ